MANKKIIVKKLDLRDVYDVAFFWWLAVYVVYGQQGGIVAELLVHTSTAFFLLASTGLFICCKRMTFCIPIHFFWYAGLIFIGVLCSRCFNHTDEITVLITTFMRILYVSFMCAVRFSDINAIENMMGKFYYLGVMELILLFLCIPADNWLKALKGERLGIGSIQLNVCALLMAISILGCIYNMKNGGKKYFIIAVLQGIVLIMFQSRTGYLALIMGLLIYYSAYYKLYRKYIGIGLLILIITVGVGSVILVCTDIGNIFLARIFRYDDSIMYRSLIVRTSYEIWLEKPFWGHGIGSLEKLMLERVGYPWAAHNNAVGLATSMGIAGLSWYYGFVIYVTAIALCCIRRKNKTIAILKGLLVVCVITDIACENYSIILTQTVLAITIEALRHHRYLVSKDNLRGNIGRICQIF